MTKNEQNESEEEKRKFVHIAVTEDEKKKWKKATGKGKRFTTMTALVKFCVEGYLNDILVEKSEEKNAKSGEIFDLEGELKNINATIKDLEGKNEKLLEELREEREELQKTVDLADTQNIKERIFTLLKKAPFTAENLAKVFSIPKTAVLAVLNEMEIEEKTVKLNPDDLTYELVMDG